MHELEKGRVCKRLRKDASRYVDVVMLSVQCSGGFLDSLEAFYMHRNIVLQTSTLQIYVVSVVWHVDCISSSLLS
jgi:hypothetical protein